MPAEPTRPPAQIRRLRNALPFWISLALIPAVWIAATWGGWWVALLPLCGWTMVSVLDLVAGEDESNPDAINTTESDLFWYRLITIIWFPIQFVVIYGCIWHATHGGLTGWAEKLGLFFGLGVISGAVGIVYSHELMHQKNRLERGLADLLLSMVLYSHFRSEHMLVHHRWVGTPRDAVSARYNEGFHRYFARVLIDCPRSAWRAEAQMLARKGLSPWNRRNPFWKYLALQLVMLGLAFAIGGWEGLGLFLVQALSAVWQLELTNYIEHYGLTRRHLGEGRYEHVLPRHSWNAAHKVSNWFLINLQRHSDHHYKPDRRFPLLQTYDADEAPRLPHGYMVMTAVAMIPPLWRRQMNPRVRAWRRQFYPDITDWTPYNRGTLPPPRGSS